MCLHEGCMHNTLTCRDMRVYFKCTHTRNSRKVAGRNTRWDLFDVFINLEYLLFFNSRCRILSLLLPSHRIN